MSSLSVDAREVLAHLNEMGYRNITAEQLKEFIRDLKKLIKYENKIGAVHSNTATAARNTSETEFFTKLHDKATTSSQAKYKNGTNKPKTDPRPPLRKINPQNVLTENATTTKASATTKSNSVDPKRPKTPKRVKSESALDRKESRMWIRPRMAPTHPQRTKDPVQLYHYYQKEWEKFKDRLPGENDHSELRWQIRHKLLGSGS